jgi:hypothetical protein
VLVQPTISHFVKNLSKSQPVLNPKQETTDVVNPDLSRGDREDHAAVTYDLSCDNNPRHPQISCEKRLAGGSSNPFAIKKVISERQSPSGVATPINEEGFPLNQVKPHRGGGHKLLSLKDRKRKHRTLSISPQSAESCGKKVCNGAAKNENIHPNSIDRQIPSGSVLGHSKKVEEDSERVKVSDARQLSCEFTTEEAALMQGYALDSERSHAEKLSLADIDLNAKPPASSSVKNQTPSKDHLLNKANRSGLSSIPCSPSFSPRKPAPKAFSPLFERTRPTSANGKEEDRLTNSRVQVSESIENSFESSAVLFSTPAAMESSQSALSSHSVSKSLPRRTLNFNEPNKQAPVHPASPIYRVNETILPSTARLSPSSSALPPAETLHQASASNDDFSFIGDISLSEFADVSRIEMEAEASSTVKTSKTFALNRHLVLEVTSQESSGEDAILCTGR